MLHWLEVKAPIREKLKVTFGAMIGIMVVLAVLNLVLPHWVMLGLNVVVIATAFVLTRMFARVIADPYVATVVRMEGLAAGDLAAPIAHTEYEDCVGRISRGMLVFRDAAVAQREAAEQQAEVVRVLGQSLERLAKGDLTADVTADFPGTNAVLKTNFNEALAALRELVRSVATSAETISTGSAQIAVASEDLSRRTESAAASLQETVHSIAEMDQRLRSTAGSASQTVARADGAIASVQAGRDVADEAVSAMSRVSESAKGIDDVIEGLDKIAFQTRVLAMNAAVEAGRAGEAGRGFAVVADLVSALAMRAEEEAGRARDQLTTTQADVTAAVGMVQRVDDAFAAIATDVREVHGLLGSMATANQAQASSIGEISTAITVMDQATQQNAAMVEQTSAAARNLSGEVEALKRSAQAFNVGEGHNPRMSLPLQRPNLSKRGGAGGRPAPAPAMADGDWASF
ncbi:methyl-accepting chemotaxis protein [Sphingomonas sp. ABOLD]|uniref:Methyl-accepting chemotaxis protein n=1 Tax=Sphingomonas trueperi TaxID=53317 RepID=A0A7X5XZH7_9SPHN|nr:methyl-accepting chemotaxis protein [Sphingomonas trueperi]RSV41312.1 methyl-accepting chemotaxis protein [Sphingomonas sp. ABOLD]RSV45502.1 methyl-accepting chemotaxis protein [Sphingomonas sp. ABOLE]